MLHPTLGIIYAPAAYMFSTVAKPNCDICRVVISGAKRSAVARQLTVDVSAKYEYMTVGKHNFGEQGRGVMSGHQGNRRGQAALADLNGQCSSLCHTRGLVVPRRSRRPIQRRSRTSGGTSVV
jgi:hypothetical protein